MLSSKSVHSPLVAIKCLVYNHEPYLRDCLDGFIMQQTNFRFVAIVHDDASTDRSADIIREYAEKYPDIICPMYEKENQYSKPDGSLPRIMNDALQATGCKYVAFCEGDDYWIDPLKLQKQVDILEADETLMGCCTNRRMVDFKGNTVEERIPYMIEGKSSCRITMRDFFKYNTNYPTASVVYRNSHTREVMQKVEHMRNPYLGDWTMWISLHCFGDFYFLDETTSAYRLNPTSVTHTRWVSHRVDKVLYEFNLLPRVADVLPVEFTDIANDLRNTNWVYGALVKAYYKNGQYLKMLWSLLVVAIKYPRYYKDTFMKLRKKFTNH